MQRFEVTLQEHERGLLFANGRLHRFLGPGRHSAWTWGRFDRFERLSVLRPCIELADAKLLAETPELAPHVIVVRIADTERGLVFVDGNFARFLGAGVHVLLRAPNDGVAVEVVDASTKHLELVHPAKDVLTRAGDAAPFLQIVDVPEGHVGVLFVEGALARELAPGRYAFWKGLAESKVVVLDVRQQLLEVQGQELMTKDKVTLRVNLSVRYRVVDARAAASAQTDWREALYRDVQLALREEIGALTLDELLDKKASLGAVVRARVESDVLTRGIALVSAGLRDVILPGDMRALFNQVIEAEKRAQANGIARREETAATRSLLNTARLLDENPTLLRLKELEVTERIAEKIGSLSVTGGVSDLIEALRSGAKLT